MARKRTVPQIEPPTMIDGIGGGVAEGPHDFQPSEEAIRQRAYEIYRARGDALGSPNEDWYRAEREIRADSEPRAGSPPARDGSASGHP